MANVLYISNDGLTDPLGQSQIIPYLQGLSSKHKIFVLSCEKDMPLNKNKKIIEESLLPFGINWQIVKYRNKPAVLGSWLMQRELKEKADKLVAVNNINLIHCRSYPASIIGMSVSGKYNIPFIFDMRGFWADERVDRHLWNKKNPVYFLLYSYFKKMEKKMLARSYHIITLTKKAKEILINKYSISQEKISVIPCAADLDYFSYQDKSVREDHKRKLGLQHNDKLLMYMGSVGTCYLLKEMLWFYKTGKKDIPTLKMAVFSPVHNHSYIRQMAGIMGVEESELICRYIPRKELVKYLSAVDYSVMFFEPSFSIQGSSPTKHGELLSMNIPVVVNSGVGDLENIVKEKETGYVINEFCEQEFTKAWKYLSETPFKTVEFQELANKYYSLEKAVDAFCRVYDSAH
ncbi:MAG: glycosyltransferase [Bacteroidota bacterium]